MPNDAKLGLVVGVALVLAIAVVFFRKEDTAGSPIDTSVKTTPPNATSAPRPALARATRRIPTAAPTETPPRKHTVREGETMYGLAQRYYGSGEQFHLIHRANQHDAAATDLLPPGTVLVIPDANEFPRMEDER